MPCSTVFSSSFWREQISSMTYSILNKSSGMLTRPAQSPLTSSGGQWPVPACPGFVVQGKLADGRKAPTDLQPRRVGVARDLPLRKDEVRLRLFARPIDWSSTATRSTKSRQVAGQQGRSKAKAGLQGADRHAPWEAPSTCKKPSCLILPQHPLPPHSPQGPGTDTKPRPRKPDEE